MADAKTVWGRRTDNAARQEEQLIKKIKEHLSEARYAKMKGEIAFRVWLNDGGIVRQRTEVLIDERNESVNGNS